MKFETKAIHSTANKYQDSKPVSTPIYLSTTFERNIDGSYANDFQYTRAGNPNRKILEESLALLENGKYAFAFASGMAAISGIMQTLKPGDHVIVPDDAYHGMVNMRDEIYKRWEIQFSVVDMTDSKNIEHAITDKTKLVWVETPSNPMMKITDLTEIARITKKHNLLLAADNTWPSPVLQNPLSFGADIVMHSSTKYIGGHSDVLGGCVIINENEELYEKLSLVQKYSGAVPAPFDCWLTARGLQTMHLRVMAQSQSAFKLAQFLNEHTKIERVFYPGLTHHPNHDIAKQQMNGAYGGMLSVQVKGSSEAVFKLSSQFKLFTTATSLGGIESLVEHRKSVEGEKSKTPGNLLRVSVGLENSDDLIEDWKITLDNF